MKANLSRETFDPKKRYTQVLMQQGRVQVDADWNEQQEIYQHRIETEARDVIGPCGAPMDNDGFKITVQQDNTLLIGKGRFYVDGILCENDADVTYDQQPYLLNVVPPDVLTLLADNKTSWAIIYLDVWRRHITALDDPHLREVALGGPDTTTRAQTVWQVKILPLPLPEDVQRLQAELAKLSAELIRAERAKDQQLVTKLRGAIDAISQEIARFSSQITCATKSDQWDALVAPSTGTLNARTQPVDNPEDPCLIPPSAGYQRLENQLYRVEIQLGSAAQGGPTFKWSRENGSVVTTIENFSGHDVKVHDIGPDDVLGFAPGQWVEVIDDDRDLKGLPGELVLINNVDAAKRVITMATAPAAVDLKLHPKIRRWEQLGAAATPDAVKDGVAITNGWQDLEGGIQVLLSPGTYRTGDYWLIPARTVTGDIEWPPYQIPNISPIAQSPLGIQHHYCRLGILRLNDRRQLYVQDCRERFPSLASPAIHVVGINWMNDDLFSQQQLLSEGLKITLDAVPEQLSVSSATVIVTAELPAASLLGRFGASNEFNLSLILNGVSTVESNVIHWTLPSQAGAAFAAENLGPPRIRVVLKGHDIWNSQNNELYYLDGQAFGQPDVRSDAKTPRTALHLPSGMGALASDFESWFYLGEPPAPLRISTINFISSFNQQEQTTFTVDLPQVPLPTVRFSTAVPTNMIEVAFSRPLAADGITPNGQPQGILVETANAANVARVFGDIQFKAGTNNTVVRFIVHQGIFDVGFYTLTIFGNDNPKIGPAIKAQDNAAALDGDFDGNPGGNFTLPFEVFIIG